MCCAALSARAREELTELRSDRRSSRTTTRASSIDERSTIGSAITDRSGPSLSIENQRHARPRPAVPRLPLRARLWPRQQAERARPRLRRTTHRADLPAHHASSRTGGYQRLASSPEIRRPEHRRDAGRLAAASRAMIVSPGRAHRGATRTSTSAQGDLRRQDAHAAAPSSWCPAVRSRSTTSTDHQGLNSAARSLRLVGAADLHVRADADRPSRYALQGSATDMSLAARLADCTRRRTVRPAHCEPQHGRDTGDQQSLYDRLDRAAGASSGRTTIRSAAGACTPAPTGRARASADPGRRHAGSSGVVPFVDFVPADFERHQAPASSASSIVTRARCRAARSPRVLARDCAPLAALFSRT